MSRVIWKTALDHEKMQTVEFPTEWRPLAFGNQNGTPTLWYECDPDSAPKGRVIYLAFTGDDAAPGFRYVGTATFGVGGGIVVHCYVR